MPPYSTGNCSGLICLSKTSFQFAGRKGKDRNVSLGRNSYLAVSPEEAEKAGPALKGSIIGWHGAHVTQDCRQEHHQCEASPGSIVRLCLGGKWSTW